MTVTFSHATSARKGREWASHSSTHFPNKSQKSESSHASPVPQPEERSSNLVSQAPLPAGTASVVGTIPIDGARQQLALAYTHSRQRARTFYTRVIVVLAALVTIFAIISSQSFAWLDSLVSTLANTPVLNWQPIAGWSPLLVFAYFVLVSIPLLAVSVPLAWYTSFAIPRRYGLRKGTTWHWLGDLGKSLSIFCIQIWLFVEVIVLLLVCRLMYNFSLPFTCEFV